MLSHFLRKFSPRGLLREAGDHSIVDAEGWNWQLAADTPAEMNLLEGLNLERRLAEGRAELVKENPARSVYRLRAPAGTVYAKVCRIVNVRAWAREVLRPAKARLEFENAQELQTRGIAAVVPLGWAGRRPGWPGESVLLTRELEDSRPFLDVLENLPKDATTLRRNIATEFGRFLARMHDAGIAHPDPHPGNLLVQFPASHTPRFVLIDVHAVRLGTPLGWRESRANLVLFNRWFQLRASRADRLRFWRSYLAARTTIPAAVRGTILPDDVERRTLASNLKFWAGRESRCLGKSRHFRTLKHRGLHGYCVADMPAELRDTLLDNPDAIFTLPQVRLLKDSRTSTVAEWPTPHGTLIWKRFRIRKRGEALKNLLRRSAALRSWVMGHSLRDRWLPTPRPLLVLHRMRHGIPAEGYLLTEKVPDALELSAAVAQLASLQVGEQVRRARQWAFRLAVLIRTLHRHGGSHRDLKASNLLLEGAELDRPGARPTFIDLVGVRTGRPIPFTRRVRELSRLNASFLQTPLVTNAERLRFLKHYLQTNVKGSRNWKAWWRAIHQQTRAKVKRNQDRGRPLA